MGIWPPHDYIALRSIPNDLTAGYRAGDGMYAQVVADLGLVLGVDVVAARPDVLPRPADTAPAAAWRDYALAQDKDLTREQVEDRADLIRRFPDPGAKPEPAKKITSKP
jgi:hypothetical protein